MTTAQIIGLGIAGLILWGSIYVFAASRLLLKDGRERRRYKALVDEDRARDARLATEMQELEVQVAMSELDDEYQKLTGGVE